MVRAVFLLLEFFFVVRFIVAVFTLEWYAILTFGILAFGLLLLYRGLAVGLTDVILHSECAMDITVEENALGIMIGNERWYLFLDGIIRMSEYVPNTLTIEHWNGSVVNIPLNKLSELQIAHIKQKMEFGRTTEGTREIVERGRIIQAITREDITADQTHPPEPPIRS